MKPKHVAETD